jgi:NMD protein affecting ribosome stability and mRNA decay
MKKFCPKCGKTILKGSFCNDCNPETIDFKQISIKLSPSGKAFIQGKWTKFNNLRTLSEGIIKKFVKQKVSLEKGLETYDGLLDKNGLKNEVYLEVVYNDKLFRIPVNVEVTLSPDVSKVGSTYFEGVFQLRNARDDVKEYIVNYCKKNNVFVNKLVDKGKEVDYYFVKKNQMQPLALKLMRNFGAAIESNARLFSRNRQTSRDIYRLNVLATIPAFATGDVVEYKGFPVLIKETGKIITGINLALGKKVTFRNEEANSVIVLPKLKSKITITHPRVEILDPETYESLAAENPLSISTKQDQNVVIVKNKGKAYLIK